jgi:hypothetical protein
VLAKLDVEALQPEALDQVRGLARVDGFSLHAARHLHDHVQREAEESAGARAEEGVSDPFGL